jgi:hypothetical protein
MTALRLHVVLTGIHRLLGIKHLADFALRNHYQGQHRVPDYVIISTSGQFYPTVRIKCILPEMLVRHVHFHVGNGCAFTTGEQDNLNKVLVFGRNCFESLQLCNGQRIINVTSIDVPN